MDPLPDEIESVILQRFLEKIGGQASNDELKKYLSSPESYTPRVTFSKPNLPIPEVNPSNKSPLGFSMDFWLDFCRGVGRFKVGQESYSLMVFPPPSKDAKDIEDTFAKFGVKLMEGFSPKSKMPRLEFYNICKENLSVLMGGNALYFKIAT